MAAKPVAKSKSKAKSVAKPAVKKAKAAAPKGKPVKKASPKAAKPKVKKVDIGSLKTYSGAAGTYFVVAAKGDNEIAVNTVIAEKQVGPNRTLGMGVRIRFYDNEEGTQNNPFDGFKNAKGYGSNVSRIKTFVPMVSSNEGVAGLDRAYRNRVEADLIKAFKAKVKASKGEVIVPDATLQAVFGLPFEKIETPIVYAGVDLDGTGNTVNLPYAKASVAVDSGVGVDSDE